MMRLVLLLFVAWAALVAGTPAGFITFFEGKDCPSGWTEVVSAKGRMLLSVTDASEAGVTVNTPLADQEDRVHSHHYSTTLALPSKSVAAIDCCNNQGACNDRYPVQGLFNTTTSGLPFGQLLLCSLQTADTNAVPYGTIAYFDPSVKQCPPDFSVSDQLRGRFLMASYSENGLLPSDSKPLNSGEDRLHSHDYATSITTSSVSFEGVNGCCNHNPAADGVFSIAGSSTNESSGLPYIQLLTCISQAKTFNSSFPKQTLLFNELSCPPGWNVTQEMSGRYIVPLPDYGVPSAIYGGPPFAAGASANVSHAHSYLGTVQTRSCGVGLDSGCCGGGFAGNGLYFYQGVTTSATLELPFVAAPMCKQM